MAKEKFMPTKKLEDLSEAEKIEYYKAVCDFFDIPPTLRVLEFMWMDNGQGRSLVLYAKKGATDIIRANRNISTDELTQTIGDGYVIFTAKGHDKTGRTEMAVGVASFKGSSGKELENSITRAQTRATRRLTLQFVGGGVLDESEVVSDSMPAIAPPVPQLIAEQPTVAPNADRGEDITKEETSDAEVVISEISFIQNSQRKTEFQIMGNTPEYYQEHKQELIQKATKWRQDNPERAKEIRRKDHRKVRGVKNPTGETKIGECEICGKNASLQYDHDHLTGEFRGWICSVCNIALGWWEKIIAKGWEEKFQQYIFSRKEPDIKPDTPKRKLMTRKGVDLSALSWTPLELIAAAKVGWKQPDPQPPVYYDMPESMKKKMGELIEREMKASEDTPKSLPEEKLCQDCNILVHEDGGIYVNQDSTPHICKPKTVVKNLPNAEQMAAYKLRVAKYVNVTLPKAGMVPVAGVGGVGMQFRAFAKAVFPDADMGKLSIEEWEKLFGMLDGSDNVVKLIRDKLGIKE